MSKKSYERDFKAFDYGGKEKAGLTEKQYLVYSFLTSISKWNSQSKEDHYYVYKNSFLIKDACKQIGITEATWRNSIKKLKETYYIKDMGEYYLIYIPMVYAPLHLNLIKYLLRIGSILPYGGTIIAVYSVLYLYWLKCQSNYDPCEITITQLKNIFVKDGSKKYYDAYKMMLAAFTFDKLIELKPVSRENKGKPYIAYQILKVRTDLPIELTLEDNEVKDVGELIKAMMTGDLDKILSKGNQEEELNLN